MLSTVRLTALATLGLVVAANCAIAQNRTSGSSFGTGTTGFGTGGTGTSGFGTSGFGSSAFGTGGLGTGGGTGGFGQGGTGQSGLGQGVSQFDVFNPQDQGFIGRDSADVDTLMQAQAAQIQAAMAERISAEFNRGRDVNEQSGQRPAIRVQLQVAFDYDRPAVTAVNQRLDAVFDRVLNRALVSRGIEVPQVEWDGREVTLRGDVPDDSSRRLIENLVKLQPGVDRVVNELRVEPSEAETVPIGRPN